MNYKCRPGKCLNKEMIYYLDHASWILVEMIFSEVFIYISVGETGGIVQQRMFCLLGLQGNIFCLVFKHYFNKNI